MTRLNQNGQYFALFLILAWTYTPISWCVNVYQLLHCNFDQPWRDEIIHILGLFPPLCWFTIWL